MAPALFFWLLYFKNENKKKEEEKGVTITYFFNTAPMTTFGVPLL